MNRNMMRPAGQIAKSGVGHTAIGNVGAYVGDVGLGSIPTYGNKIGAYPGVITPGTPVVPGMADVHFAPFDKNVVFGDPATQAAFRLLQQPVNVDAWLARLGQSCAQFAQTYETARGQAIFAVTIAYNEALRITRSLDVYVQGAPPRASVSGLPFQLGTRPEQIADAIYRSCRMQLGGAPQYANIAAINASVPYINKAGQVAVTNADGSTTTMVPTSTGATTPVTTAPNGQVITTQPVPQVVVNTPATTTPVPVQEQYNFGRSLEMFLGVTAAVALGTYAAKQLSHMTDRMMIERRVSRRRAR